MPTQLFGDPLAERASADVIADSEFAYARLLFGVELLATDFSEQAIAAKQFDGANLGRLECASGVPDGYTS